MDPRVYERLVSAATVGLKVVHIPDVDDPDSFRYAACNDAAAAALDQERERVVGQGLLELFPAARNTPVIAGYQRCIRDQVPVSFGETSYPAADGSLQWFRAEIVPLGPEHVGTIFTNVTAEREARTALDKLNVELEARIQDGSEQVAHRERELAAILRSTADIIVATNRAGEVLFSNIADGGPSSLADLCGHSHAEAIERAIEQAIAEGRASLTLRTHDHRVLSLRLAPIRKSTGEEVVVVIRDDTEMKRLERELYLNERMTTLGTLAAGIGHEINNPLQAVMLNLELLDELGVAKDGEPAELVSDMRYAVTRIRDVVDELRHFVQERGSKPGEHVDMCKVIDHSVQLAAHQLRPVATVRREYDDVPTVQANAGELGQVVLNLLINAAQAIEETRRRGEITIRATATDANVVITIDDDGPGIPADLLPHIFDPFFSTKEHQRQGLGLSVSHRLVERNGGTIAASSRPEGGARFTLTVPIAASEAKPRSDARRRPTIMLVEDDAAVARAYRGVLRDYDVRHFAAYEGAEAALAEIDCDLVLCDVRLGGRSGVDLWRKVRQDRPELSERFCFVTGGVNEEDLDSEDVKAAGVPVLFKPLDAKEIRRRVEQHLKERASPPSRSASSR